MYGRRALADLIELHDNRRVPLSSAQRGGRRGPYPYYGAQGIIDWIDDFKFNGVFLLVPEDGENLRSRNLPIAQIAEGRFWVNNHAHVLQARSDIADLRFLKYAIESTDIGPWVTGAAQPKLSQANLREIQVPCPSLALQKKIADVLATFDDLIDNSRRRIAVLDASAQELYKEWFVRYRFPGHRTHARSQSASPSTTWPRVSFRDLGEYTNGFAFKPVHWQDNGMPIIKIKELKNGVTHATPRYPGDDIDAKFRVQPGDLLFSWSGDLDAYLWPGPSGWLNQHLFRVEPAARVPRTWLFLSLRAHMNEFRLRSQGTTMKHIQRSALDQVRVDCPDDVTLASFDSAVDPILQLEASLKRQVIALRAARDLLLPSLVKGKINIEAIDTERASTWAEAATAPQQSS